MHTEYDVGEIIEDDGAIYTPFYEVINVLANRQGACLLYTSDAADE